MLEETRAEAPRRDTEGEIYTAAVRLFSERGYYGTSLRELAKDVGLQMASLYYHFPSKQDLLMQIMTRGMHELISSVSDAVSKEEAVEERLHAGIRAHVLFHANRKMEAFVIDQELRALDPDNRDLVIKLRDSYERIFDEILAEGVRSGAFRQVDVRVTVAAIMTMCTGVASWYRMGGRLSLEQIADTYADLVALGVLPSGGRAWERQVRKGNAPATKGQAVRRAGRPQVGR